MPNSSCGWRLSAVLSELQYPAQKWMIQTAAELYGADVQTRTELRDLPEITYYTLDEVIAAVEGRRDHVFSGLQHHTTKCCGWRQ